MDQQAHVRFFNSRWGRALSLVAYLSCLISGIANHNWFLGVLGVLGLGTMAWKVATGRPMMGSAKVRTREEAIEELYPKRRRVLIGAILAVLVSCALGVVSILGGVRRDDAAAVVVGCLLVLAALMLVLLAVRIGLIVRDHGRGATG